MHWIPVNIIYLLVIFLYCLKNYAIVGLCRYLTANTKKVKLVICKLRKINITS